MHLILKTKKTSWNLYFFSFFCSILVFSQQDYKGKLVDSQTGESLPYVNIGFLGKGIGTVSDEEGVFHLTIDKTKLSSSDVLLFTAIGYETIEKKLLI